MPVLTGPFFSMTARGQVAKRIVANRRRGTNVARNFVVPRNPRTAKQIAVRDTMAWLSEVWKSMDSGQSDAFIFYLGSVETYDRVAFMSKNIQALHDQSDLAKFVWATGASHGLPPPPPVVTPHIGGFDVDFAAPALPVGASNPLISCWFLADQSPQTGAEPTMLGTGYVPSPYHFSFTGLPSGKLYRIGAWLYYLNPQAKDAWGRAVTSSVTTL